MSLTLLFSALGGYFAPPQVARMVKKHQLAATCRKTRSLVLTYDDGPGASLTAKVLDCLRERHVHATFFPLGMRAARHPEVLDRVVADGHEVGCHGFSHCHAWKTWPWTAVQDIRRGYATLARWVPRTGLFRPPYGKLNLPSWLETFRRNAPMAWWTLDSGDSQLDLPVDPDLVVASLVRAGGGVVLMHDFDRDFAPDIRERYVLSTTERLLEAARREQMTVRTMGQVLGGLVGEPIALHRGAPG